MKLINNLDQKIKELLDLNTYHLYKKLNYLPAFINYLRAYSSTLNDFKELLENDIRYMSFIYNVR